MMPSAKLSCAKFNCMNAFVSYRDDEPICQGRRGSLRPARAAVDRNVLINSPRQIVSSVGGGGFDELRLLKSQLYLAVNAELCDVRCDRCPVFVTFLKMKISRVRTQRRSASPRRRVVEPYPSTHVAAETEGDTGEKEGAIINN